MGMFVCPDSHLQFFALQHLFQLLFHVNDCHGYIYPGNICPLYIFRPSTYMVSLRQEQNPIMNFAVPFLQMLALCMVWKAQYLSDFYANLDFVTTLS